MALTRDHVIDTMRKINAYDQRFSKPAEIVIAAWCEHFEQYPTLTVEDTLEAVKMYYRKPGVEVPKPADISYVAREVRRERNERWTDEDMAHFEALCNAKAAPDDDGYPPPDPYAQVEKRPATDEERKAIESAWRKPE